MSNEIFPIANESQKKLEEAQQFCMGQRIVEPSSIQNQLDDSIQKIEKFEKQVQKRKKRVQQLSQEESCKFYQLYLHYGSSWRAISKYIPRPENELKNRFYSSLRKAKNILHEHESEFFKTGKWSISPALVIPLIDLTYQLKAMIVHKNLTPNEESLLFKFRRNFLKFCFAFSQFSKEEILKLIQELKYLNGRLKCFGIFKVKNRKQWKLSTEVLQAINQIDNIILVSANQAHQQPVKTEQIEINEKVEHSIPQIIPHFIPDCNTKDQPIERSYFMMQPWPIAYPMDYGHIMLWNYQKMMPMSEMNPFNG